MSKKKKYPAEFVEKVKAEYPDRPALNRALDSGNEIVGRYLNDGSLGGISPDEIIKMIDQGQIQDLRKKAGQLDRRKKLYEDWSSIAEKMFNI